MDYHYRLCHHPSLSTLCQEQWVAVHEEKQSRVVLTMNCRTPISVKSLVYSKTQWNADYLHVLYAFFRTLPFSFGYTEMEITEKRGEVVWWLYTLDLIKAFLARHVKIFEVASWRQCFADQQGGFWKERKRLDSSLEADLGYNHTKG